ncbi:hypothetical protein ACEE77_02830 [Staphylococcus simulans]
MKEKAILKSLHVCLGINVKAYDSNLNEIQKYTSKKMISPQYNELDLIKSVEDEKKRHNYYILTGAMNEVFLLHNFEDKHYLFGPFNVHCLPPDDFFTHFLKQQNISIKFKKAINDYAPEIKLYSLEDIRDIIKLVHYLFTLDRQSGPTFEPIHNYVEKVAENVRRRWVREIVFY